MKKEIIVYSKYGTKFGQYIRNMKKVWRSFSLIEYYTSQTLPKLIKNKTIPYPSYNDLIQGSKHTQMMRRETTFGMLTHVRILQNPRASLLAALQLFEVYISDITALVYFDYPKRGIGEKKAEFEEKIIDIIIESNDKKEILERLIEEKIRGIFYGNIANVFIKDELHLELKDTFKEENAALIETLKEIIARRNIYVHNDGRVDSKYLRETKRKDIKLNAVLQTDAIYLRDAILVMNEIAKLTTIAIIQNIYKGVAKGKQLCATYWTNPKKA